MKTTTLGLLLAVTIAPLTALSADHPVVPAFERFYGSFQEETGKMTADEAGRLLIGELSCLRCHQSEALEASVATKQAPLLAEVGSRAKADWLQAYLLDPHKTKPGATMPDVLAAMPAGEKQAASEALVHFLIDAAGGKTPEQALPNLGAAERGEELFHTVGCAACHGSRREGDAELASSVPLPDLSKKYTLPSLSVFLREPLHARPAGRMPNLNLSASETRSLAGYLLGLPGVANVRSEYYEGDWKSLPDFSKLKPKKVAGAEKIGIGFADRGDRFALRFEGFIQVEQEGEYTFHLGSDDGSRLLIDGELLINNDGVHAHSVKSGKIKLAPGTHSFVVEMFEAAGDQSLTAEYEGPGVKRQPLATGSTSSLDSHKFPDITFQVDPAKAAKGRELFASQGCASCHAMPDNGGKPIASSLRAKAFAVQTESAGCMAEKPTGKAPFYGLNNAQRTAIAAAAKSSSGKLTAEAKIAHTLATHNCYACHQRGERGGVEEQRNEWFATTIKEMGDEGRIPPPLTGVGGKLTKKWLADIFTYGVNDRPYMLTRMPKFGADNVGHLTELLAQEDKLPPLKKPDYKVAMKEVKRAGHQMVGEKGFACIKCHTFGRFEATGIQSIDMTNMRDRLQEEWFRRYLANPQVFRPRTRMPSAWPEPPEKSLLPDILDGESETQIAAVWDYLKDGPRARLPQGLISTSTELIPFGEAIMYRNFIAGAGSRAIGVGYPESVSLAFDANEIRLALVWQGRFIDATRHWSGRGQGYQPPAGENVKSLQNGMTFAVLENEETPWPGDAPKEAGYKFLGYRLDADRQPTFLYSYAGATFEDYPKPAVADRVPLRRTLTIAADKPVENLYMRVASGSIEAVGDDWYEVEDFGRMRITSPTAKPIIREVGGREELLIRVVFQNGKASIVQDLQW